MNPQHRLILGFAAASVISLTVGCASNDRVDVLERDIRSVQGQVSQQREQQQLTQADVAQQLTDINERNDSQDQRLAKIEATVSTLSDADRAMEAQIADLNDRLGDRVINLVFKHWLTYAAAVVILLLGIAMGVWGHRFKVRSDLDREANLTDSDEASDGNSDD